MSCCWLFGVILISSSLESSYIRLNCQSAEIVRNRKWSPLKWKYDMSDGTYHYWRPEALKNGSWNGFSFYEPRASWGLGLDRFVDDLWIPEVDSPVSPAIFENETNIEAGPTRLLFQADFSTWFNYEAQFICDLRQDYVESRVNCSRRDASARQNCTVTAQRPSQRRHAPENISPLSFIDVFRHVSYLLPRGASGLSFNNADLSIQYLIDPKLTDLGRTPTSAGFQALNGQQLGSRLSQLLNTYVQLSQMHMATSVGSINNGTLLEANITAPVEVANLVEVYVVSNLWAALSILSSIVLILGGWRALYLLILR
jgi:hypothetical protein